MLAGAINIGNDQNVIKATTNTTNGYSFQFLGDILDGTGIGAETGDAVEKNIGTPLFLGDDKNGAQDIIRFKLAFSLNASPEYMNMHIYVNATIEGVQYRNNTEMSVDNSLWPNEGITGTLSYSPSTWTNGNVTVTLTTNGALAEAPTGWAKVDATHYTKIYTDNGTDTVTLTDIYGKTGTLDVSVTNIDRIAPTATISYNITTWTNQPVTATMTASEPITTPAGWTMVDSTHFTKVYTANWADVVAITDLAGNIGSVTSAVANIDTTPPTIAITDAAETWFNEDFNTSPLPYSTTNAGTVVNSVSGSVLNVTSTATASHPEAYIYMYNSTSIDVNKCRYVEIRYNYPAGSPTNMFELYPTNATIPAASANYYVSSSALIADGQWHTATLDLWSNSYVKSMGTITGWRFDWTNTATPVTMQIDYIRAASISYTVTYADPDGHFNASTLTAADITLNTTGTATGTVSVSGTGTTRTVLISNITGEGTLGISIAAGTGSDLAGNLTPLAGPSTTFPVDTVGPVISYTPQSSVFTENFNLMPYTSMATTTLNSTSGGIINVTSTSSDPQILMYNITSFDVNKCRYIEVKYRLPVGSSTAAMQVFPTNASFPAATPNYYANSPLLVADGQWHTATIDLWSSANVQSMGTITGWRFDWTTATGVTMDVDSIKVVTTDTTQTIPVGQDIQYTITYTDANFNASTLTAANITLNKTGTANGTIMSVTGTGNTRTVLISGITGDGTIRHKPSCRNGYRYMGKCITCKHKSNIYCKYWGNNESGKWCNMG